MMAGSSFGPLIAAGIHDATGSYAALLWTAMPVMLICSFLFIGLGPYPEFDRSGDDIPAGQPIPAE